MRIREAKQGDAGYIAYMHGRLYKRLYNLGGTVEYYFMKTLTDFVEGHEGGCLWIAEDEGVIVGAVGVVRIDAQTAQIRWFIVEEKHQGAGIGGKLFAKAMEFCRLSGYERGFLWTFSELHAARRIYEKNGFKLVCEKENREWREEVVIEQKWEARL